MRHVGMTGRIECLTSRDLEGRLGYVLVISTIQRIPHHAREDIQQYFRRKLTDLGELRGESFMLVIHDGEDLFQAHRVQKRISSARVASLVAAANMEEEERVPADLLAERRRRVQELLNERRGSRGETGYQPLNAAPLTDLGALPAA